MKKVSIKQLLYYMVGLVGLSAVSAFQMKLNVGVSPWDALGRSVSHLTYLKVGDVAILQAIFCISVQFLVLRKDFKIIGILSLLLGSLSGKIMNVFYYNLFEHLNFDNYILKVLLFILAVSFSAFFVAMLQTADFVELPIEAMCKAFSDKGYGRFSRNRQLLDVFSVSSVLILTFIFKIPMTLGLGTIISLLLFGPLMGMYIKFLEKRIKQFKD